MKVQLFAALSLFSVAAMAAEAEAWNGSIELGYKGSSREGESAGSTFDFKATANKTTETWKHKLSYFTGITESPNDEGKSVVTDKKKTLTGRSDYIIKAPGYFFGELKYDTDEFGTVQKTTQESIGYGYGILSTDAVTLNLEAGVGAKQFTEVSADFSEEDKNETAFSVGIDYEWKINKTSTLKEEWNSEFGETLNAHSSTTSLIMQLAGNLSASFSLIQTWDEFEEPADENNEVETSEDIIARLIYSY